MLRPENQTKKYDLLFAEIDSGQIKIPSFQREFVWSREQTARLIDSIIKGFPIGTFIFWRTREYLRHERNIGNSNLPEPPTGESVQYVLDGQQRITSLYAARKGVRVTKDKEEFDYRGISINLDLPLDTDEQVVMVEPSVEVTSISIYELLNSGIVQLVAKYGAFLEKIEHYKTLLTTYDFSTVVISDYPLDIACEVFTRINTGGTKLTLFEIMVAKTYDRDRKFDLAREYEYLIDNNGKGKDLEDAGFETVPESTVLQCSAAHICGQVRTKDILKLSRADFINNWPIVKDGIFTAVDYVRTQLRIPVSLLLPYHSLLVPLTYFFIRNENKMPSPRQNKLLTQYFWWASLSNRFSSAAESKLGQDLKRIDKILAGEKPEYRGEEVRLTLDDLCGRWFSTGDAICKAILCLYAYMEPKSFATDSLVKIDNSWLKVAFSKNYHHFFPRAYLTKVGFTESQANTILNITIVDDYLNKRKIGAKAPSVYMREFKASNSDLSKTMHTHLIDDMDAYGIWTDDYNTFIRQRGRRVMEEIKKRLEPDLK